MPGMHLRQLGYTYSACRPFTESKERIQKYKETGDSRYITKTIKLRVAFNMIWLMEILGVYHEEEFMIKYYVINHLILLKIHNMMDNKKVLLGLFIILSIKILLALILQMALLKMILC